MACLAFVRKTWAKTLAKGGHDGTVLGSLVVNSARPGYVHTTLKVGHQHLNNHNTVHGGVLLSLTDTVTSLALQSRGIVPPTGASVNISCEFVRPGGRDGDELIGIGEVVQLGRTLAYTRVNFHSPDGKLVAFGNHTKHMGANKPTVNFSEDGETEIPLVEKHHKKA
ncbi:hypothetical protein Q8F55_004014 [Vanrija albida]|uniref:Thioesterase domain-containing protein n=1 Tax=Vanrija albida TaxID=181172 RepID=A0ABR3Q654_9TREE